MMFKIAIGIMITNDHGKYDVDGKDGDSGGDNDGDSGGDNDGD